MKHHHRLDHQPFLVPPGKKVKLKDYDPNHTMGFRDKQHAREALLEDVSALAEAQHLLWASGKFSVLIILQALDAAGKDGTIRHVMSGVNPQGCDVTSFRAPNEEERSHPFLWRPVRYLPARGRIAIFNRSYYEEVLVVRVHPEFLESQWLPPEQRAMKLADLWRHRFAAINDFERALAANGTAIVKFFLNISKTEQRKRLLARLDDPAKNWKFNLGDVHERSHWGDYQTAYEEMLAATSTEWAPWHVIPADKKWFSRACVADIIVERIERLGLETPRVSERQLADIEQGRQLLQEEKE